MKAVKKSIVCILMSVSVMLFGAWTPNSEEEQRYADAPILSVYASETIAYTDKVFGEKNTTNNDAPKYKPISGLTNSCGAVAGSIMVGFYDKYYSNLIENWDSYFPNGKYRGQDAVYVPALMNELYRLMRTNVDDVGVSQSDFLSGLQKYISGRGYAITYRSVATTSALDYGTCKETIDSNNLIVIFSRPGDVYTIGINEGYDDVTAINISDYHIMVAYGYQEINYYNANGLFRTDIYLNVMTGRPGVTNALYKISPHNLQAAYAVTLK